MIGYIFNTLESVVIEEFGEDVWDELLEQTGSEGVYHSLGNYSDEEAIKLVVAASEKLGKQPSDILRWFGERAISRFYEKWPEMFDRFDNLFEYILSLNDIIHPQVKQLYPGAQVPYFKTISQSEDELIVEYTSSRQMCHLAEGLILGSAKRFDTPVEVTQPSCVHNSDNKCHLSIKLVK